jgi:glyoxylate carboligase
MPIVHVKPPVAKALAMDLAVVVDSDARTNAAAIIEVERWCAANGLVRARENWLRRVHRADGTPVWRAVCYQAESDRTPKVLARMKRRAGRMPETPSSVDLSREE